MTVNPLDPPNVPGPAGSSGSPSTPTGPGRPAGWSPGRGSRPLPGFAAPDHGPGPRRGDDRRIAVASMVVALGFLVAAAIALLAGPVLGAEVAFWLPLHLALAGGASTAIAGVMPFFVAALSAGEPARPRVRAGAIALVAIGASLVAARGVLPEATLLPPLGGITYLTGIALTGEAVREANRRGLMIRRPIVILAYSLALVNVALGATLGTLEVAGFAPVVDGWERLRSAHAWTNLVGFVSLVIVGTLLHFLPTVLGTRIVARRTAIAGVAFIAAGSPIVVAGLVAGSDAVVRAGAVVTLGGAASLAVEAVRVGRSRGRWTTDPGWHRLSSAGLLAGVAWFVVGVGLASIRLLAVGASPDAWSSPLVGAPLAIGWVGQVLVASWTHLLPAIGPGGPAGHAVRRAILGRLATVRLVMLNAGAAAIAFGWPAAIGPVAAAGVLLVAGSVALSAALAIRSLLATS